MPRRGLDGYRSVPLLATSHQGAIQLERRGLGPHHHRTHRPGRGTLLAHHVEGTPAPTPPSHPRVRPIHSVTLALLWTRGPHSPPLSLKHHVWSKTSSGAPKTRDGRARARGRRHHTDTRLVYLPRQCRARNHVPSAPRAPPSAMDDTASNMRQALLPGAQVPCACWGCEWLEPGEEEEPQVSCDAAAQLG